MTASESGLRWHHTAIRVKDPKVSVPFYETHFGMKLIHSYKFSSFSLYYLESLRDGATTPTPNTDESQNYLWNSSGNVLELTHNHGSEDDASFKANNGNIEPHRGFGHIALNCADVVEASKKLEANGVKFQKRPDEGKMKNIAFALDPDGYWIELVNRSPDCQFAEPYNLSQTMIRVKDPAPSVEFYSKIMKMSLVRECHYEDFSLYFLANLNSATTAPDPKSEEARDFVKKLWQPVLELTHNHGTEKEPSFSYHNGNDQPQGFAHIAFLCDSLTRTCAEMEAAGVPFRKKPEEGSMRDIAFLLDPDGYSVELVQKGLVLA